MQLLFEYDLSIDKIANFKLDFQSERHVNIAVFGVNEPTLYKNVCTEPHKNNKKQQLPTK